MNYNGSLLRTLYTSTSGKYLKLKVRLEKARQSGRFYTLSKRKQRSLVQRLIKLFERLKSLQTQLRLSGIGAAIALAMSATPANAQSSLGPFVQENSKNPLPPPSHIALPKPASVDIDGDLDQDVFVGDKYGKIHFFRNTAGKDAVRRLNEVTGEDNPLDFVDVGQEAAPAFIDIDNDGDFDLLVGTGRNDGTTHFFRNISTSPSELAFEEETGSSNPFNEIYGATTYGKYGPSLPTFADIDGDSDVDVVIGSSYIYAGYDGKYSAHAVVVYRNNGSGEFTREGFSEEFYGLGYGYRRSLTFVDLDGNGDLDILSGTQNGGIEAFIWDGSYFVEQYGDWDPSAKTGNPFNNASISGGTWINLVDLDGDGDLDALIGTGSTYSTAAGTQPIRFFENNPENTGNFVFVEREGLNSSPFEGVDVHRQATPSFTDIDGDGDLDAILGSKYIGALVVYKNEDGYLFLDPENPLTDVGLSYQTLPVFADIDGDGDQDLFITAHYDDVKFLENDGGTFSETDSPIDLSELERPSLAFIDIDNDEDLDAFAFNNDSRSIIFFKNDGGDFQSETAPEPFNDFAFDGFTKITSVDIDHDGDLDLVASATFRPSGNDYYYAFFRFFDNNGSGSFTELPAETFNQSSSPDSFLNFGDVDGDGDLDLFVGNGASQHDIEGGTVTYYENQNPAPVTNVSLNSVSVTINTPAVLDPDLTINDEDDDDIVQATITISNFAQGNELLAFTASGGLTGEFEDGILTIKGKAGLTDYETILRTVTYEFTGNVTSAKQSGRAGVPPAKTVTFTVRDTDFTETIVSQVNVISLSLIGEPGAKIVVYNAVSPGVSSGLNDYMRIEGLPVDNKVTIFNRWGDQVFEISGYDNVNKRFEGKNDNGKELPSGTYFYKIEASNDKVTGYLSLKR